MNVLIPAFISLCVVAQPQGGERELVTQLPVESVDYVIVNNLEAERSSEFLQALFKQLKVRPRYELAVFSLPGEERPRLVYIRGRDTEVRMVKKVLGAMEEAGGIAREGIKAPFVMRIPLDEISPADMRRRLLKAAGRAGMALSEKDFFIYPEGPEGSLFFIGKREEAACVTEMSNGLDREGPLDAIVRVKSYLSGLWNEIAKAFGVLLSTLVSALAIIVLHLFICHIPVLGPRYRRSFHLFWGGLFAAFRGTDLAWEIIRTAAGLGVASGEQEVLGGKKMREVAPEESRSESLRRVRDHAIGVASDFIRWRGIAIAKPGIRRVLEAAIDMEMARRQ
jgi:hypothetical protein